MKPQALTAISLNMAALMRRAAMRSRDTQRRSQFITLAHRSLKLARGWRLLS